MSSVARAIVEQELPPGVPIYAMGAATNRATAPVAPLPSVSRLQTLLDAARQRTASLFQKPTTAASPSIEPPRNPIPTLRSVQLEKNLDSLEQRSTTLGPNPVQAPPNYNAGAYLTEMSKRPMGGK